MPGTKDRVWYQTRSSPRDYLSLRLMSNIQTGLGLNRVKAIFLARYLYHPDYLQHGWRKIAHVVLCTPQSVSIRAYFEVAKFISCMAYIPSYMPMHMVSHWTKLEFCRQRIVGGHLRY
ncbi:unnamed protein product [Kuraishia capsulata CBS 1993]|uniref:Uncharacterized protein n=1 Tax=Kuraishia capsulata CBS 1993 TaxID=1382522 RepID=W6MIU8_9ASCO|nr:uncharacterized protein KUCA_T00002062001 [Kuraishia capsulata CBS 1993]CDK26091.1 unnamed protein product [Kuraishia capsulata CBS 1993]